MKTEKMLTVVETHSCGETTKVVISGFPRIRGRTMLEKMKYCQDHFDHLRRALMTQPRGFSGILGAIVTEPANPMADFGVIFTHAHGYFPSCGDSTFSVAKALIEQGMVEVEEPNTAIVLDTAAGLVRVRVEICSGGTGRISFKGPPSFYQTSTTIDTTELGKIHADIAFGGLYYAIVNSEEVGVGIEPCNADELIKVGMNILNSVNNQVKVRHPENPEIKIQLVTFHDKPVKLEHYARHANVYANTICVSPAGTSVSAILATLVARGVLKVGQDIIVESMVNPDLTITGKAVEKTKIGDYEAIIPELSTHAYIIGMQQCIIEKEDPIGYGFLLG